MLVVFSVVGLSLHMGGGVSDWCVSTLWGCEGEGGGFWRGERERERERERGRGREVASKYTVACYVFMADLYS